MPRFCLLLLLLCAQRVLAAEDREAFNHPLPDLSAGQQVQFFEGRTLMHQSWIVAPSQDTQHDGLGPLYNQLACSSCHPKNGRGRTPDRRDERLQSALLRLSLPGPAGAAPRPHPAYGEQLNEQGIPGVPGEGSVFIDWQMQSLSLDDGQRLTLRRPRLRIVALAYGPLQGALTSLRVGPTLIGMGLLDAVSDETLHAMAAEPKPDGVRGRVNQLRGEDGQLRLGRFGLKANAPNLRQQIANAMLGDLGISSSLHPQQNCRPAQRACRAAPTGGEPELSEAQLDALTRYLALLQVPPARAATPATRHGAQLFMRLGCALCHRPQLRSGAQALAPQLAGQDFAPYSDLLLHDMGESLADHRPDYEAGGRDWRTAPLWGIGRIKAINEHSQFLHDGRARDLQEAILWHGGEAQTAQRRYRALSAQDREALLDFLRSL
ncbi:CxxC motif-containing protein, DUF1111 family [Solimonas aquatica]|uniref:CxxC motif-containing protein, DUF1111 family n=1 Tax=Solimonas aquatica TaxID=489703 RepID=A0A1H9H935_9GAMM|nr:di-heme oxidoredictase family protein [Solimonas aquatica]SEQ58889.1 CxxC motif-containing protein, DUF1111 family [Solimonas aquatica]